MGSNLASILTAIADTEILLDGNIVSTWLTSDVQDTAEIPQLPVRLISPIGMQGVRSRQQTLGSGAVLSAEWRISDIVLIRGVGMGLGMRDVAELYTAYMTEYLNDMRAHVYNVWRIETIEQKPQVVEYPIGSGRKYHAIVCTLLVSEIVQ